MRCSFATLVTATTRRVKALETGKNELGAG